MEYRFRVRISGKVQGVFFRKTTSEKAHKLGLKGMVKNENGGVVYECQGIMEQCFQLIAWTQFGPPMAEPDGVRMEQIDLVEGESGFEITY